MQDELYDIWRQLPRPQSSQTLSAAALASSSARIGRSADNGAAILVPSPCTHPGDRYGLATEHIRYDPARSVEITCDGAEPARGLYSVIECSGRDPDVTALFLRIAAKLPLGHASEFDEAVRRVFELFRSLTQPSRRSVQGLWSELFVCSIAADPDRMVDAWHSHSHELFDFIAPTGNLEVKSTAGPAREHDFSLEQLLPPVTYILSLILLDDAAGPTIFDLVDQLEHLVTTHARRERLRRIAFDGLGSAWGTASEVRFSPTSGFASLRAYRAQDIPRALAPASGEVRSVRFRSTLTSCLPIEEATVSSESHAPLSLLYPVTLRQLRL